jgi:hypothetical protein
VLVGVTVEVIEGVGVIVLVGVTDGVTVLVGVGVGLGTEYVKLNEQFAFVFNSVTVDTPSGTETRRPKLVVKST